MRKKPQGDATTSVQLELPLEPRPWIWRYCKLNPDADHRSDKPGRESLRYNCCRPHGHCLVGFGPPWQQAR